MTVDEVIQLSKHQRIVLLMHGRVPARRRNVMSKNMSVDDAGNVQGTRVSHNPIPEMRAPASRRDGFLP